MARVFINLIDNLLYKKNKKMIILRPEEFGGIAFNTKNANEIYLDRQLFDQLLKTTGSKTETKDTKKVLQQLGVTNPIFEILGKISSTKKTFPFPILSGPTLADIHITDKCNLNCPHCYVKKGNREMTAANFELTLNQCQKLGIFQIAIGGGEPTLHPKLGKFLKIARQKNIVPNITTNGKRLSWRTVYYLARYAGAVALSIEETGQKFAQRRGFTYANFLKSVKKLKAAGINLVFQITLSRGNLDTVNHTAKELLKFKPYGLIFLAYKPQGNGKHYDAPLSQADTNQVNQTIARLFTDLNKKTRIGFDCCLTPALIKQKNSPSFSGCSAARTSLAIMPNLDVIPCSFLNQQPNAGNLKQKSLLAIWQGDKFNNFRDEILKKYSQTQCQNCSAQKQCLGGCPAFNLVKC